MLVEDFLLVGNFFAFFLDLLCLSSLRIVVMSFLYSFSSFFIDLIFVFSVISSSLALLSLRSIFFSFPFLLSLLFSSSYNNYQIIHWMNCYYFYNSNHHYLNQKILQNYLYCLHFRCNCYYLVSLYFPLFYYSSYFYIL